MKNQVNGATTWNLDYLLFGAVDILKRERERAKNEGV